MNLLVNGGRYAFAALLTAAMPLMLGCAESGPEIVPVSGQVLIDGEPLATGIPGFVQVVPAEGRPAFAAIDPQTGRFALTTREEGDGCLVGTHQVIVMMEQMVGQDNVSLIPEKYSELKSTDLMVTIDGPTDALVIELTGPLRKVRDVPPAFGGDPDKF